MERKICTMRKEEGSDGRGSSWMCLNMRMCKVGIFVALRTSRFVRQ